MEIKYDGEICTPTQIRMKLMILGDEFHLDRFVKFMAVCDFCKFDFKEPIIMNGTRMCHISSMYDELLRLGAIKK